MSVALPYALRPCVAAIAPAAAVPDYIFFDDRFARAQRLAASWSVAEKMVAVQGDVTPVWTDAVDHLTRAGRLGLRGVTTDSFRFCLKILLEEHSDLDLEVSRLDQNLFVWAISATLKPNTGTLQWLSPYHRA